MSLPVHASAQAPRIKHPLVETYESTAIDDDGNLQIVTADHKTITVRKDARAGEAFGTQTAFQAPVISPDGRAIGAQAMFGNCCTSYDIPLQLVIRAAGTIHRFEGGLAIFDWHFVDGGKRVAYSQQTVHLWCSVHWKLRDIATERLLASSDIPEPCGQIPEPPKVNIPVCVCPGQYLGSSSNSFSARLNVRYRVIEKWRRPKSERVQVSDLPTLRPFDL